MDMRSAYLDTEIMAVIHSEAVTEQLNQYMSSYEAQSVRIMENGQVEIPIGMERQKISQKKKRKITFLKICNWLRFLM